MPYNPFPLQESPHGTSEANDRTNNQLAMTRDTMKHIWICSAHDPWIRNNAATGCVKRMPPFVLNKFRKAKMRSFRRQGIDSWNMFSSAQYFL
mmetsp:Transcript_7104/g.14816  ORF Transcript_7104/g.14816 Transcript_7104/m.14816 type:complete len:93 (+) Transcript_7104:662-940(+)